MKIWKAYGSEHSMNLVMIGHFEDASSAAKAKEKLDRITVQFRQDEEAGLSTAGEPANNFTKGMMALLRNLESYHIQAAELEQFSYDFRIDLEGERLILTTDEIDVSAILKLLIDEGAKVEVYSAHSNPGTGYGRNTQLRKD